MAAVESFVMPSNLVEAARSEGRDAWLAAVPRMVHDVATRWSLTLGGPYQPGGQTAWVAPARDAAGRNVVLKVGWRHDEAAHEADGLRAWDGNGTVVLHRAEDFDDTAVLLLEQCRPGTPLSDRPALQQDVVIAGLLRRLWREPAPGHPFRPLQVMCDAWADEFEEKIATRGTPLDAGIAREGVALFRSLPQTANRSVLLCTDLHAGNVLAAEREPWLVIDPKPYVGDPTYDALQHLLNSDDRLAADPRALVQRVAGLLGIDASRLLQWLFARCVVESAGWPMLADVAHRIAPR